MFKNLIDLLGDKPIYKSLTVWGAFIWFLIPEVLGLANGLGLIGEETVSSWTDTATKIGPFLAALGIRRKLS